MYPYVAESVRWRNEGLVQEYSGAWNSQESDVDRGALLGVNLDSPSTKPVLKGVEVLLEV